LEQDKAYSLKEIQRIINGIPGWLKEEDVLVFSAIYDYLNFIGLESDSLEIGVYKGKSGLLMMNLIKESENLYLCDIFEKETSLENENEIKNSYEFYDQNEIISRFKKHFRRNPKILNSNSIYLKKIIGGKKFKFIHVDGSHEYAFVKCDVDNVYQWALHEKGIVSFDDYSATHAIGVTAAIWDSIISKKLKPIIRTPSKIYCIKNENEDIEMSRLDCFLTAQGLNIQTEKIFDFEIKFVLPTKKDYQYFPLIQQLTPPKFYSFMSKIKFFKFLRNLLNFLTSLNNPR
jgi:hypothetical protein